ncbi:MAG TPA: nuclear transport factor 2 family protein [Solirubrobacterales bacterium]|nr:nuclear transport factor 2 family protein [Solirubrobacterales bacterium]
MTKRPNVEIFERLLEDFNRDGVEGALPYFDDDVEVYDPDLPEGRYRGRDALRWVLEQFLLGAERTEVRGWEFAPAGDRVVGLLRTYSRAEGGSLEVEVRDAHTMTFRDGKIVYWRLYLDRAEALSDAGLDPELAAVDEH